MPEIRVKKQELLSASFKNPRILNILGDASAKGTRPAIYPEMTVAPVAPVAYVRTWVTSGAQYPDYLITCLDLPAPISPFPRSFAM